jgi:hypothetical protein
MNLDIKKEYERIKDCVIYVDWNTITYVSDLTRIEDVTLKSQCDLLISIFNDLKAKKNSAFPYSIAHLLDIRNGDVSLVDKKLIAIESFTNGWTLQEDIANEFILRLDKCLDCKVHFNWYEQELKNSEMQHKAMQQNFSPLYKDISNTFRNLEASLLNDELWNGFMHRLVDCIENPNSELNLLRLNKDMRNQNRPNNGASIKFPQLNQNSVNLKREVNEIIAKSSFPFQNCADYISFVHPTEITVLSNFENNILRLSQLADFVGVTSEKLQKETAFKSITTDLKHLVFALRSHIFISNDHKLLQKAKFISTWLGLNTQIFKIPDFIKFINDQNY